jgi:hypothetical protein
MKSAVPYEIGIIATLPPTATTSPPQDGLVLAKAFGAVRLELRNAFFDPLCKNRL